MYPEDNGCKSDKKGIQPLLPLMKRNPVSNFESYIDKLSLN